MFCGFGPAVQGLCVFDLDIPPILLVDMFLARWCWRCCDQ